MPGPSPSRRKLPLVAMTIRAALEYFAIVFVVAFALGTLRTLVVAPWLGALPAVLLEVPLILLVAWFTAARVLRRWPVEAGGFPALLAMGGVAFTLLMLAEALVATHAFGQSLTEWLASLATPEGLAGLAGQIAFALVPLCRGR